MADRCRSVRRRDGGLGERRRCPKWFDIAREFTERWVHHRQLLDALGEHDEQVDATAEVVMDILVWAYPYQYRAPAPVGTTVALRLGSRPWVLTRHSSAWELDPGAPLRFDAQLAMSADQAWRILTGGAVDIGDVERDGPGDLLAALLGVRAAIV